MHLFTEKNARLSTVFTQHPLGHDPKLITALPTQHGAAVLREIGVFLDGETVADLVLHAVDEEEDGHQALDRGAECVIAREEGDVQAQAVG